MTIEEVRRIIVGGTEAEKVILRDYFKKYGNTLDKEKEVHEIFVDTLLQLNKQERIALSGIIGYPVFLRIALYPEIRHSFPLLQDGAALVLIDQNENVLVQQRMDNGKYGFSGGCQELGEELTDVAIRECYEEAGLLLDKSKIINLCEVSGLSRRNSYPNGDVVVNNTALHIGYLEDCTGELHKDFESKQVMFKPVSFLEELPEDAKHESDFVTILRRYFREENVNLRQEDIKDIVIPEWNGEDIVSYVLGLTPDERIVFAKKIGYERFLLSCVDKRIRDIFPHLVDKGVLISINGDEVLIEERNGVVALPKRGQSVGENFENLLVESFGVDRDSLKLAVRLSGNAMYVEDENAYYNTMIFKTNSLVKETDTLRYEPIEKVYGYLSAEDQLYYETSIKDEEVNKSKKK